MSRASLFIPLTAFVIIAALLYAGFSLNDAHLLPSALIGKPFPAFDLASLDADPNAGSRIWGVLRVAPPQRFTQADLRGRPRLVNVWATWCPTCRAEHADLLRIHAETGLPIVGVNYKDSSDKAREWLRTLGNPYEFNIVDADGQLGVELGVYGAPESFLVDASGTIVYKRVGEVNRSVWEREIKPHLDTLTSTAPPPSAAAALPQGAPQTAPAGAPHG